MDDYAGRAGGAPLLAGRYRLSRPPSDPYAPSAVAAYDTASGQRVLAHRLPLPETVEAEVLAPQGPFDGDAADTYGPERANGPEWRDGPGAPGRPAGASRTPEDPVVRRAVEAASAAARLPDHPRLGQVFDVFVEGEGLWVVGELVHGRPLSSLLAERPLSAHRAAEIAADLLAALRAVHAYGWTHRNVTARTVLILDDGRALLTGLAEGAAQEALCGYDPFPEPERAPAPPRGTVSGAGGTAGPAAGPEAGSGAVGRGGGSVPAMRTDLGDGGVGRAVPGGGAGGVAGESAGGVAGETDASASEGAVRGADQGAAGGVAGGAEDEVPGEVPVGGAEFAGAEGDAYLGLGGRSPEEPVHEHQLRNQEADGAAPRAHPEPGERSGSAASGVDDSNTPGSEGAADSADLTEAPDVSVRADRGTERGPDRGSEQEPGPGPGHADGQVPRAREGEAEEAAGSEDSGAGEYRVPEPGVDQLPPDDGRFRGPATPLAAERALQARLTVVGAVTERWAPEQAGLGAGGRAAAGRLPAAPIGPAADLWALGALLFRALHGRAPYPEESAAELVRLVAEGRPVFADGCGPLRPAVEALLRQVPAERPDFGELAATLRSLVRGAPEPEVGRRTVLAPPVLAPGGPSDPRRLPILRRRGELVRRRRFRKPSRKGRRAGPGFASGADADAGGAGGPGVAGVAGGAGGAAGTDAFGASGVRRPYEEPGEPGGRKPRRRGRRKRDPGEGENGIPDARRGPGPGAGLADAGPAGSRAAGTGPGANRADGSGTDGTWPTGRTAARAADFRPLEPRRPGEEGAPPPAADPTAPEPPPVPHPDRDRVAGPDRNSAEGSAEGLAQLPPAASELAPEQEPAAGPDQGLVQDSGYDRSPCSDPGPARSPAAAHPAQGPVQSDQVPRPAEEGADGPDSGPGQVGGERPDLGSGGDGPEAWARYAEGGLTGGPVQGSESDSDSGPQQAQGQESGPAGGSGRGSFEGLGGGGSPCSELGPASGSTAGLPVQDSVRGDRGSGRGVYGAGGSDGGSGRDAVWAWEPYGDGDLAGSPVQGPGHDAAGGSGQDSGHEAATGSDSGSEKDAADGPSSDASPCGGSDLAGGAAQRPVTGRELWPRADSAADSAAGSAADPTASPYRDSAANPAVSPRSGSDGGPVRGPAVPDAQQPPADRTVAGPGPRGPARDVHRPSAPGPYRPSAPGPIRPDSSASALPYVSGPYSSNVSGRHPSGGSGPYPKPSGSSASVPARAGAGGSSGGGPASHGPYVSSSKDSNSRRRAGRWALGGVAAAVVAAVVVSAVWLLQSLGPGGVADQRRGSVDPHAPASAPPPASAHPSSPSSSSSSSAAGGGSGGGVATPHVPGGYKLSRDPAGFDIAVPAAWHRRSTHGRGQVHYSGGRLEMIVVNGRDSAAKYGRDPMAYQSEDEPELSGYRASDWASTSGLRRIAVGEAEMAEGAFVWRDGGRQLYARNRATLWHGRYHLLLVQGPKQRKEDIDRHFEAVADTYRVTKR